MNHADKQASSETNQFCLSFKFMDINSMLIVGVQLASVLLVSKTDGSIYHRDNFAQITDNIEYIQTDHRY